MKRPEGKGASALLSQREEEVVSLVAQGFTNVEAAALLQLSIKSIETYRARAMEKLGIRNRAELLRFALANGWLKAERLPE